MCCTDKSGRRFPPPKNSRGEAMLDVPIYDEGTIDPYSRIASCAMPMLKTEVGVLEARNDEFSNSFDERMQLESTFMHYDQRQDPGFRFQQRRQNSSERAQDKSSWRAGSHLLVTSRLGTRTQPALREDPDSVAIAWRSNGTDECDNANVDKSPANAYPAVLSQPPTALMVCNLPCRVSADGLSQVLEELGFAGLYYHIYVPRGTKNNMGYGFVYFFGSGAAARFVAAVGTYSFSGSTKRAYCKPAACHCLRIAF